MKKISQMVKSARFKVDFSLVSGSNTKAERLRLLQQWGLHKHNSTKGGGNAMEQQKTSILIPFVSGLIVGAVLIGVVGVLSMPGNPKMA